MVLVGGQAMSGIDLLGAAALTGARAEGNALAKPAQQAQHRALTIPVDTASLSSEAPAVSSLAKQALTAAEARAGKVEALRRAVASAEYSVDAGLIADAIISQGA